MVIFFIHKILLTDHSLSSISYIGYSNLVNSVFNDFSLSAFKSFWMKTLHHNKYFLQTNIEEIFVIKTDQYRLHTFLSLNVFIFPPVTLPEILGQLLITDQNLYTKFLGSTISSYPTTIILVVRGYYIYSIQ